ncbi:hypothetical protein [Prochlorococcus sp. MIT 0604]|uniref:hypothetical protein n=1 Tax=Prochlorococcus sp. MIT 0604 TaxID=1501268 RepID=UPI000AE95810
MGLKVWTTVGPKIEQSTKQNNSLDSMNIYAYPTKAKAIEEAKNWDVGPGKAIKYLKYL